uniref:Uncharacterized protein n=1 Tax=Setaria italica TaxID=4555 RepID=K3Y4C9_SETIT
MAPLRPRGRDSLHPLPLRPPAQILYYSRHMAAAPPPARCH